MADDNLLSSLTWQAPLLGMAIGALSTIKATGDDPDKSKEEFLKLLVRNTALGGLAGGGLSVSGKGLQVLLNAYNSSLPGNNRGTIIHAASYNPLKNQASPGAKKLLSLYKKAYINDELVNSLSIGIGTGGLVSLLTYILEKKEKNNLYNVFGTGGLAGLSAGVIADQYQTLFPKKAMKKIAENDPLNNPLVWGLPAASITGLLSYLTQTKGKRNKSKILKHALTGGLLGAGAGIAYKWLNQQPTTEVAQPLDATAEHARQETNGYGNTISGDIFSSRNKAKTLNVEDDLTLTDYGDSLKTMGAGILTSLVPCGPIQALGATIAADGAGYIPMSAYNSWNAYSHEVQRKADLDKQQQELLKKKSPMK